MIRIDDDDLRRVMNRLARVFAQASNGKLVKRELSKQLRALMRPLVMERRSAVQRLPSKGHSGPRMRQAIARQIRAATRWKGKNTGISIIQKARGMPRDFAMAGRAFNREEGWNPQNLGGETVHQQVTPVEWWDSLPDKDLPVVRQRIIEAISEVADTMADDIRRIR